MTPGSPFRAPLGVQGVLGELNVPELTVPKAAPKEEEAHLLLGSFQVGRWRYCALPVGRASDEFSGAQDKMKVLPPS